MLVSAKESLNPGQTFTLVSSGFTGRVLEVLGAGGQGTVYLVEIGSQRYAFKWYHEHILSIDVRVRERISRLIERGAPDDRYLWPIELVEIRGKPSFGFVMPVRPDVYRNMKDLISAPPRRIDPSLAARATTCLQIAESFLRLHAKGFCYQDINFGGFFINATTGDICICDVDNVDVHGQPGGVYGTRKFMAPEVVRREALPDTWTDLYSMAVLFFYILFNWHPLDGKREAAVEIMDQAAETALYGTNPVFLFDPVDQSNGPLPGIHDWIVARWRAMPGHVRDLFVRSFTRGLREPASGRVVESEWRQSMARLRDAIVPCPRCGFEHGIEADHQDTANLTCTACATPIPLPPRLVLGRDVVVLKAGTHLYAHHLDPARSFDFDETQAVVERHPTNPDIIGIKNLTKMSWSAVHPSGGKIRVDPGRAVKVEAGVVIDFGRRRGTLKI